MTGNEGFGGTAGRLAEHAHDLHAADRFAIAGIPVPEDLAPADPAAGTWVPHLAQHALALPPAARGELRRHLAALPQQEPVRPLPEPRAYEQYPPGPGAVLMRLARNRNRKWLNLAKTLYVVTGRCWSAVTYGGVGRGTVSLTPDLLADFAAVIDIPADRLAALTGLEPPAPAPRTATAGIAELLWDARRLTATQLRRATDHARALHRP
ncbi:hypothetical protein ACFV4G_17535 [Kitasatospora sp. NPDC059747]|uniref:hypothetical protein n=1 Tax=Kitasatospora sp. NPDC059747 TaxID=3346930 RepID=UPI00365BC5D9